MDVIERIQVLHDRRLVDASSEFDQSRRLGDGDFVESYSLVEALGEHIECAHVVKRQGPLEHANNRVVRIRRQICIRHRLHFLDQNVVKSGREMLLSLEGLEELAGLVDRLR